MLLASMILAASASGMSPPWLGFDLNRARQNLERILIGTVSLAQLSALEREEIRRVREIFGTARRPRETREACLGRELSPEPSELERAIADLKCSQRPG
jgi:hypothetical protein